MLSLRHIKYSDIERIRHIRNECSYAFGYTGEITEEEQQKWYGRLRQIEGVKELFCVEHETLGVVGTIGYNTRDYEGFEVEKIMIDPKHQGSGLFKTALGHVLKFYSGKGKIFLFVKPDNDKAIKSYTATGFVMRELHENGLFVMDYKNYKYA
jgi:RimJ/RimL family protein N-acetyltransferase